MITFDPTAEQADGKLLAQTRRADDVVVECHENRVPPFAEAALQQLYANVFSTLAHQRVYAPTRRLNTYVERSAGQVRAVWLFERSGRTVRVLNEGIEVDEAQALRFARHVFSTWPGVGVVRFHAVQSRVGQLPLPYRQHNCLEDMVLTLPASARDYLAQMGKSTRSYINRYLNKLRREHPSMRFELVEAHEIDEADIRHIIELNRVRMSHKGKVSINDAALAEQITHLAMDCGMIGMLSIDGRIVAGTINYRVRGNYFLEVIAHDPQYNAYRLGTLCCYLTICECIERGGEEYHFLWGQDEYKSRLLGKRRDLDDIEIYRSRAHMLLHADTLLRQQADAALRRLRLQIRDARQGDGPSARLLNRLLELRRRLSG